MEKKNMNVLIINIYLNKMTMAGAWHPPLDWKTSLKPFSERSYFNMVVSHTIFEKLSSREDIFWLYILPAKMIYLTILQYCQKTEFGSVDFHIGWIPNNIFCY